jgi:hypothetical protein
MPATENIAVIKSTAAEIIIKFFFMQFHPSAKAC